MAFKRFDAMGASSQRLPAAYLWKTCVENSIESRTCGRCEVHLQVASVKPDSGNVRDVAPFYQQDHLLSVPEL
jgi:hypothetical protein